MLLRLSETSAATKRHPTVMEHQASKVGAGLNIAGALLYHASVPVGRHRPRGHTARDGMYARGLLPDGRGRLGHAALRANRKRVSMAGDYYDLAGPTISSAAWTPGDDL